MPPPQIYKKDNLKVKRDFDHRDPMFKQIINSHIQNKLKYLHELQGISSSKRLPA